MYTCMPTRLCAQRRRRTKRVASSPALFCPCLVCRRQEPEEPYLVVKDPQAYLDPQRMYQPRPGMGR